MIDIKVAFFGSPQLAALCLSELIKVFQVKMVFTKPDKMRGRGKKVKPTPVKEVAQKNRIPVYQPEIFKNNLVETFQNQGIELIVVVAYGKILPEKLINYPRYGSLNLHASLLPKYRGPSPIQSAIINGERLTGVTLQLMNKEMDKGDILAMKEIIVEPEYTAQELLNIVMDESPGFLVESILGFISGKLTRERQREDHSTYCPVIKKENGLLDWNQDDLTIIRKIKAYNIWPAAFTFLDGKLLRIFNARTLLSGNSFTGKPGEIVEVNRRDGILVKTGRGVISVLELQLENKKRMMFQQFINGYRNLKGKALSPKVRG